MSELGFLGSGPKSIHWKAGKGGKSASARNLLRARQFTYMILFSSQDNSDKAGILSSFHR